VKDVEIVGLYCREFSSGLENLGIKLRSVESVNEIRSIQNIEHVRAFLFRVDVIEELEPSQLVRNLRRRWPLLDVICWFPNAAGSDVRKLIRAGAKDVIVDTYPTAIFDSIEEVISNQTILPKVQELAESPVSRTNFEGMKSRSSKMWDIFETCEQVAETPATVLVIGETGTGKELVARAIHRRSKRSGRFVAVNCGAIAPELIDSELFGHVKGTFTGAIENKKGLFEHADGGTLFLDELGNIPLDAQYRLLRVLQEGKIRAVGSSEEVTVDVRIVAATNASLQDMVMTGEFREDLFYRLNVIRLDIPALRERQSDILFLFSHFSRTYTEQYELKRPKIDDSLLDALLNYEWPGNVRQLENFVERIVLISGDSPITAQDFYRWAEHEAPLLENNIQSSTPIPQSSTPASQAPMPASQAPTPVPPHRDMYASQPQQPYAPHHPTPQQPYTPQQHLPQHAPPASAPSTPVHPHLNPAYPVHSSEQPMTGPMMGAQEYMETPKQSEFVPDLGKGLKENIQPLLEKYEYLYIDACMKQQRGRVAKTAEVAGISRRTLLQKMKKYNIDKMSYRD
tara:strand:- start:1664 stop:3370 length:1707 start_codon:yes stop_codon:yes gene_type:complete